MLTTMYLLDTNGVSQLRKPKPHGAVGQWIQAGIELTCEQDEPKAIEVEHWLELVSRSYNVIAMDALDFRVQARLMRNASDTLYDDAMIGATAGGRQPTVVTRNVADFKGFGVNVLYPFALARR